MTAAAPPTHLRAAEFVGVHQHGLWRWLRTLGCEGAAAEEHCQDALLAALHHGVDGWPATDARRWLRFAARNLFWMQLRSERRRPPHVPLSGLEATWAAIGGDDDGGDAALQALAGCVGLLPARERSLMALRYEQGLPRPAIGDRLGLGDAGVKQAPRRLRERLRRCIEGKLGHDTDGTRAS